jgi:hypothetical protein
VVEWIFAGLVLAVGVANLAFVHPVPAMAYGLVSLVYVPPANALLKHRFGISIHPIAKIALGVVAIVMFTLGVSDLGDMID